MTGPLFIRRYRSEDWAACRALFEGNIPTFFTEAELATFEEYLERPEGPYLVIENATGQPVACGGVAFRGAGEVSLCWGMVDVHRHREGIGRVLVQVRLALASRLPGILRAYTKTADGNVPFFEREGLRPVSVIEGYFRPSQLLMCELDAARRSEFEARLAALLAQGHRVEDGLLPER
ncbi:MAG: GNAT family N-acetyltransferase [Hyalangium sp.]